MCGVAGIFDLRRGSSRDQLQTGIRAMTARLVHRGPDDSDTWIDTSAGVALGHRRLSILDLSAAGRQPMRSHCGRYVLVYNGEVYNFAELARELEDGGLALRSRCDSEVLLEGFAAWGIEDTLNRANGMFAFALWDTRERMLCLGRDRMGIKPLYWSRQGDAVVFGSELKALTAYPQAQFALDRASVACFLRHGYIPAPASIYQDVFKLRPGSLVTIASSGDVHETVYWDLQDVAARGARTPVESVQAANDELARLLATSVKDRMISDVPLGAFLSGGIDSTTVVALMQRRSTKPIKTFSIGFDVTGFNEAPHAKKIADYLGTDHTELYAQPSDALDIIPQLPSLFDEPFADSSQIPTALVCRLARQDVTVSLSGDGGDELFAGYTRYRRAQNLRQKLRRFPRASLRMLGAALGTMPEALIDTLSQPVRNALPRAGDRAHRLAQTLLSTDDPIALYRSLISNWNRPLDIVVGGSNELATPLWDPSVGDDLDHYVQRLQLVDMKTYLPGDILTKVDRLSMAVSLEARVPLLDHRIVEYAWRFPPQHNMNDTAGKLPLRAVLAQYVPTELWDRPKQGFGVPVGTWMRGALRDWCDDLLSQRAITDAGYLAHAPIRKRWREHADGVQDWSHQLWNVLVFQAWLTHNT